LLVENRQKGKKSQGEKKMPVGRSGNGRRKRISKKKNKAGGEGLEDLRRVSVHLKDLFRGSRSEKGFCLKEAFEK